MGDYTSEMWGDISEMRGDASEARAGGLEERGLLEMHPR